MGALETNTTLIYGIHIRESATDGSDFSNGATDYRVLFLGEDGLLHVKDSAGTVTSPYSTGTPTFHGARVYGSGDLTPGASPYTVLFNTERFDTDAYHDTGSNTGRLTIPTGLGGKYLITAHINYNANPVGVGRIDIRLNGTTLIASMSHNSGAPGRRNSLSTVYAMAQTDYVECIVTNASLDVIDAEANASPEFSISYLGT